MNKITLIGNATKDAEARTTPNGKTVCAIDLAVGRKFDKEKTDFFHVVTWNGLAETCGKYVKKGMKLAAVGELQARTYEAKDGTTRLSLDVQADEIEFLSRSDEPKPDNKPAESDTWKDINADDLPF